MPAMNKQYLIFIGKKVRALREKMGLSQQELGKIAKFHRTYVGMIERGEKNITMQNLVRIAKSLKVRVKDLIDF